MVRTKAGGSIASRLASQRGKRTKGKSAAGAAAATTTEAPATGSKELALGQYTSEIDRINEGASDDVGDDATQTDDGAADLFGTDHEGRDELPIVFVKNNMENRVRERHLMRDLILHIPFVAAFVYFMFAQRSTSEEFFFTDSIQNFMVIAPQPPTNPVPGSPNNTLPYFPKIFMEIGNFGDFYDWMESVLAIICFSDDPSARSMKQRYFAGSNRFLGSLRIRTKRVKNTSCEVNPAWYPSDRVQFPRTCYGPMTADNEDKSPFTAPGHEGVSYFRDTCTQYPLQFFYGQYANYDCTGYSIDIPFNTTQSDALAIVAPMRPSQYVWIPATRLFVVEFFAYNDAIDTFFNVKLPVEITEGGGCIPWTRIKPFAVFDKSPGVIVYNAFFIGMILVYFYRFCLDWYRDARLTNRKLSFLMSLWNLMQLANLLLFIPTYILWFEWVYYSNKLHTTFNVESTEFPELLSTISELYITQVYVNSVNCVLTILLFLKYVQLNQQLNILQRTVLRAIMPLVALIILFVIIVFSYALAGNVIFGYNLPQYRTISFAFVSSFRALLGDFDYLALWNENKALAFIYFWSFIIIGLFMMLNFIVAIMMGAFGIEKALTKQKSVARLILETLERARMTWRSRLRQILIAFCTPMKLPDDILFEQLALYVTDQIRIIEENEEQEHDSIEEMMFHKHDFTKIVPLAELEEIGGEYLRSLWYELVEDYDAQNKDEEDEAREKAEQNVYSYTKEAIAEYFGRLLPRVYDATAEEEGTFNATQSAAYTSSFAHFTAEEEEDHEQRIQDSMVSVRLRKRDGSVPQHPGEVITELRARALQSSHDAHDIRDIYRSITSELRVPNWLSDAVPPLPLYSGRPSGGPKMTGMPDVAEAIAKTARHARLVASIGRVSGSASGTPKKIRSVASMDGLDERETFTAAALPELCPPEFPGCLLRDPNNSKALPLDGDWIATASKAYVWSRARQFFMHLPSGHFCDERGEKWIVPVHSETEWTTSAHRQALVVRSLLKDARISYVGTWVTSVKPIPRPFEKLAPSWGPLPRIFPNSTPIVGTWDSVPGYRALFVPRDDGVILNAVTGTFYDPASRLWFVPELDSWLPADHHYRLFAPRDADETLELAARP